MKIHDDWQSFGQVTAPLYLAVGVFDGVHQGHQQVMHAAIADARSHDGAAWVLTFDRHPLTLLRPDVAPPILMSAVHKMRVIERTGLDGCLVTPFTRDFAAQEPHTFIENLCAAAPSLRAVYVGVNWRFGKNRAGTIDRLRELASSGGFEATVVDPVYWHGDLISSTRIRDAVRHGHLDDVRAMLNRPFTILGRVVAGNSKGRELGFPTANIEHGCEILPPSGVYAARVALGGSVYSGVLNLGSRPTLEAQRTSTPMLEVHLLDFTGDLYDRELEILFVQKIREERQFSDAQELQQQIAADAGEAAQILNARTDANFF
jgi:riboflavin kinase/FMN adenylyltransferase